ncbi:hypothetical protein WBG78_22190 [Chryseolinea sp. T2]|uniref:hypothetical protein n=1 Tax=Chryseolinea sp. T2 TaxID=3129255 RepID=UPI0030789C8A
MISRLLYYLGHWEVWHWFAKYILIGPAWLWYCLKARSFWFFTPSNPTITFGGFVGESKFAIYKQLPLGTYPSTALVTPDFPVDKLDNLRCSHGLKFPIVAKPDVGQMGLMFRKIESLDHFKQYHRSMPVPYVLQEYIDYPIEVSVFYYRMPGEDSGRITGFVKKEYMQVVGDGVKTLRQLIGDYPRARYRRAELFSKHESKLSWVVPNGEPYVLSHALNLSRGGRLVNLENENDSSLLKVFDDISRYTKNFYYGRYDVKCRSIEDLKAGRNFSILEYNGAGAEPHHVYSGGFGLFSACSVLVKHWGILFRIAEANRKKGIPVWHHESGRHFINHAGRHMRLLKVLDESFEFCDSVETVIVPAEFASFAERYSRAISTNSEIV